MANAWLMVFLGLGLAIVGCAGTAVADVETAGFAGGGGLPPQARHHCSVNDTPVDWLLCTII